MESTSPNHPPPSPAFSLTHTPYRAEGKDRSLDDPGRETEGHLVAFLTTMFVNNFPANSAGEGCSRKVPSSVHPSPRSIRQELCGGHCLSNTKCGFFFPAHGCLIHLILDVVGTISIGIYLEQEFGPARIGTIYLLSALSDTFVAALFVRDTPVVTSLVALLGLLGAKLSAILRNWKLYTHKASALLILSVPCVCNFLLGLLPYVNNYANVGGLISGLLLGFILFPSD